MPLHIEIPCREERDIGERRHVVKLSAGDDPDAYRDVELEIPDHDIEAEVIAVELGEDPSECMRLKQLADKGFYHLLGDPDFLKHFLWSLKRGEGKVYKLRPQDINPEYYTLDHLGAVFADFFEEELSGEAYAVGTEEPASLLETVNEIMPSILDTKSFQDHIVELARNAYDEEEWDFLKELSSIAQDFYSLETDDWPDTDEGPGYKRVFYNIRFNIGDSEYDSARICVEGYYDIPDMEWVTDVCDHDSLDYQSEEFLQAVGASTDYAEYLSDELEEPGLLDSPDGYGSYSIWVDDEFEAAFEDESSARDYFDVMCSSARYQAKEYGRSWEIELKELAESAADDEEDLDYEDEDNWDVLDTYTR